MVRGVDDRREGDPAAAEPAHRAQRGDPRAQPLPRPDRRATRPARPCVARAKAVASLRRTFADARLPRGRDADAAGACTAAHPRGRSSRTRTPSTPSCTCASRPSCSSSAPSSAASTGCSRSTATSATRAPTPRTAPSSRCSRRTRPTATTTGSPTSRRSSIQNAAIAVAGSHVVTWADGTEYDLGGEWDRISMYESLSEAAGVRDHAADAARRAARARRRGRASRCRRTPRTASRRGAVGALREGRRSTRPTFVMDFPVDTSPLVRAHRSIAGRRREVGPLHPRLRAGDRLLRAGRPRHPARALRRAGEARGRAATSRRCASTRSSCARSSTACRRSGGMGMGIDRLLMALTGPRHPRDDPVPAGQVMNDYLPKQRTRSRRREEARLQRPPRHLADRRRLCRVHDRLRHHRHRLQVAGSAEPRPREGPSAGGGRAQPARS